MFGLAAAPTFAAAQEPLPSLFGFVIGQKLPDRSELLPVNEDETSFVYTRRQSRNKEYSLQNVSLSKLTNTIVRIFGMATHKDIGSCRRQEFEIITQLRSRYPSLNDKIEEVSGTVHHILAYERPSCSFREHAGSMNFRVPCSSNFHVYCQAESNRLFNNCPRHRVQQVGQRRGGWLYPKVASTKSVRLTEPKQAQRPRRRREAPFSFAVLASIRRKLGRNNS
jgi:hypothetical protein